MEVIDLNEVYAKSSVEKRYDPKVGDHWEAYDPITETVTLGRTREEALDNLLKTVYSCHETTQDHSESGLVGRIKHFIDQIRSK